MDTAMRDMEQIQERDDLDGPGRKIAMLAMAALSTVGLVFAMGILLGKSAEVETAEEPDPLAALDDAVAIAAATSAEAAAEPVEIDRQAMTFHETLVGDERPEVAAAMAAAAAELAHLEPIPGETTGDDTLAMGAYDADLAPPAPAASAVVPIAVPAPARAPAAPEAPEVAPAGNLALAPIAAAATEARVPRAEAGSDGEYTLQVISYRTREEADVFAEALRARGHAAFVQTAEVPERGTYHRVRVGPFASMREADRYRAEFEVVEHMNSFVVRRRD